MGKGTMRDTVDGPRAMVIHLGYTSADSHQKPTSLAGGDESSHHLRQILQ